MYYTYNMHNRPTYNMYYTYYMVYVIPCSMYTHNYGKCIYFTNDLRIYSAYFSFSFDWPAMSMKCAKLAKSDAFRCIKLDPLCAKGHDRYATALMALNEQEVSCCLLLPLWSFVFRAGGHGVTWRARFDTSLAVHDSIRHWPCCFPLSTLTWGYVI